MAPLPRRAAAGSRLFEVECECGEVFRVAADLEATASRPPSGLLVRLEGRCPWCGLRLEEIEPFGDAARRTPPSRPAA